MPLYVYIISIFLLVALFYFTNIAWTNYKKLKDTLFKGYPRRYETEESIKEFHERIKKRIEKNKKRIKK